MSAEEQLLRLLGQRYSVGPKYLASPGPNADQWAQAAALALRAPDPGGLRPYRFVVVGDAERPALAELFAAGAPRRGMRQTSLSTHELGPREPLGSWVIAGRPTRAAHLKAGTAASPTLSNGQAPQA